MPVPPWNLQVWLFSVSSFYLLLLLLGKSPGGERRGMGWEDRDFGCAVIPQMTLCGLLLYLSPESEPLSLEDAGEPRED